MNCQNCHKNFASVRYAEVVDAEVKELHLCQECLTKMQDSVETGFEFSTPSPFVRKSPGGMDRSDTVASLEVCPTCGKKFQSMLDTGKVGCSVCYQKFPAQLESILEGIHAALIHRGKVPRLDDNRARVRADLQNKRALLKTALGTEKYEEAASLRDEIRALETGLSVSESGAD